MSQHSPHGPGTPRLKQTMILALSALGVVYGDIGTSPLYAVKECFHGLHAIALTEANVLGVLSLIFWSLTMVVSLKYVCFILRADNKGEGGIFSLFQLLTKQGKGDLPAHGFGVRVPGPVRGRAALRGRGDHPGHLRALGRGRPGGGHGRGHAPGAAPDRGHPVRTVLHPALRHGRDRPGIRPGDDRLVHHHRGPGLSAHPGEPGGAGLPRSFPRRPVLRGQPAARGGGARLRGPVHHRRRGPLCGHGPFRPPGHPHDLVRRGLPRAPAQLHGPGRGASGQPGDRGQPLLRHRARGPALSPWSGSPPWPRPSPPRP